MKYASCGKLPSSLEAVHVSCRGFLICFVLASRKPHKNTLFPVNYHTWRHQDKERDAHSKWGPVKHLLLSDNNAKNASHYILCTHKCAQLYSSNAILPSGTYFTYSGWGGEVEEESEACHGVGGGGGGLAPQQEGGEEPI